MRMEREGLVRQGNAIRPTGLVAVVDDHRPRAIREPPCCVEPPAGEGALPDAFGNKAPDFEPMRRRRLMVGKPTRRLGSKRQREYQRQANHRASENAKSNS